MAAPMPEPAPVTREILLFRLNMALQVGLTNRFAEFLEHLVAADDDHGEDRNP